MPIRMLLADDHKLFRDGLRTLFGNLKDVVIAGEASSGSEALRLARELAPDIILMDISMPDLNGIEVTRQVLAERPSIKIIILSMHSDRRYVAEALRAGAAGYLLKDSAFEELVDAIRDVLQGRIRLSDRITNIVVNDYVKLSTGEQPTAFTLLSAREREVLQLLAEGKSTKEMATRLNISVKTVETHRKQIMDKLDIRSVAELTKYAVREGLTPLE